MPHIPPLDPNVAARKGFRESEERTKRFWKAVHVGEGEGGWAVLLDGRTPKKVIVVTGRMVSVVV